MATEQELFGAFSEPSRWFDVSAAMGGYVMTDPLTGDELNPNAPPVWLEEDGESHAGLEFLRINGHELPFTLILGEQTEAEDLGDVDAGTWFEDQVAGADYYGFSAFGYSKDDLNAAINGALALEEYAQQEGLDGLAGFLEVASIPEFEVEENDYNLRVIRAAALSHETTRIFSHDLAVDGPAVGQAILHGIQTVAAMPTAPSTALALAGLENAAEWHSLAKSGVEVGEMERAPRNVRILETMGGGRQDIVRKALMLGVPTQAVLMNRHLWVPQLVAAAETAMRVFSRGVAKPEDVAALKVMHQSIRGLYQNE